MRKIDLFYGFLIGIASSVMGIYLFVEFFTDYEFATAISMIKAHGKLGKLITVGAVLNLGVFFLLLKLNRELMARGVVLATIILTFISLIV